jgi:type IV pilus assembly protein PilA
MKKFLKNPSGFTLVELMVVVAIIGILSAIAVPNFKKYQAKSKQSEAKIQLAAIYNSEVGAQSDYDTYATCLPIMGYEQSPRGYYTVGFVTGIDATAKFPNCASGAATAAGATAATTERAIVPKLQHMAAVTANKPADVSLTGTTATQTTFTAAAEASISSAVTRDIWSITETKNLSNNTPGY